MPTSILYNLLIIWLKIFYKTSLIFSEYIYNNKHKLLPESQSI